MIGDSAVDIQTARNAEVLSCGVEWGFQPEGFAASPPDFLVQNPQQLLDVVASTSAARLASQGSSKAT
jgi:phosphoglycolate phosphatase